MKLESQVVSLELAKKLKELGVEQDSLFAWVELPPSEKEGYESDRYGLVYEWELAHNAGNECISAFTVAELGERLPLELGNHDLQLWREKGRESWDVAYNTDGGNLEPIVWEQDETEANARAKMLVYLIKNKLI